MRRKIVGFGRAVFVCVKSNQSLTPIDINAEMIAEYLSLTISISDCYTGLLGDVGNCTGLVEDV
jgi:hypothetical protein